MSAVFNGLLAMACIPSFAQDRSRWRPAATGRRALPFVVLFDGSSGSSWFAESLARLPGVFVAGYEPLEWTKHSEYEGANATKWQAAWLSHIWTGLPWGLSGGAPDAWQFGEWVPGYLANTKLDPQKHHAPLTVRMPRETEVVGAVAVGFKVRPSTIAANLIGGTLREALQSMGGRVIIWNRRSKVKQALSLYRRVVQGKGQFGNAREAEAVSFVSPVAFEAFLKHREEQAKLVDCLVAALGVPAIRLFYEDLLADFDGTMRIAMAHIGLAYTPLSLTSSPPSSSTPSPAVSNASAFVKRTPSSLCDAVSNLPELCRHFLHTPYRNGFEPFASQGCRCEAGRDNKSNRERLREVPGINGSFSQERPSTPVAAAARDPPMLSAEVVGAVVGTHHKTGTDLMGQVLRAAFAKDLRSRSGHTNIAPTQESLTSPNARAGESRASADANVTGGGGDALLIRDNWTLCAEAIALRQSSHHAVGAWPVCLDAHVSYARLAPFWRKSSGAAGMRFIHFVRDPFEACISGYQYHLRATEAWLHAPLPALGGLSWHIFFHSVSEADGLLTECVRAAPEILEMAELYLATHARPDVRTFQLERVVANFTAEMRSLLSFATGLDSDGPHLERLVRAVSKLDLLAGHPPAHAAHISSVRDKDRLRGIIYANSQVNGVFEELRQLLGYDGAPLPAAVTPAPTTPAALDAACVAREVQRLQERFWNAPGSQQDGEITIGRPGWTFALA